MARIGLQTVSTSSTPSDYDEIWKLATAYKLNGHTQALGNIGDSFAFLGHLLVRFDLEFFGVTLTTHGTSYLGLIMRLGGVYETRGDSMGRPSANAIIQQFATRYFHPLLHPLVFKWIISLYPDHLISAYDLKRPSKVTIKAKRFLTACFLWVGEHIAPDPKDTFTERRKAAQTRAKALQTPSHKPDPFDSEMPS